MAIIKKYKELQKLWDKRTFEDDKYSRPDAEAGYGISGDQRTIAGIIKVSSFKKKNIKYYDKNEKILCYIFKEHKNSYFNLLNDDLKRIICFFL